MQVQSREVEDHVRVDLHPDTHIMLGYFDPSFCEAYIKKIQVMLKAPNVPGNGYRLAAFNDFGSNPLVNPRSHSYVLDLVWRHPLVPCSRMEHSLRLLLKGHMIVRA